MTYSLKANAKAKQRQGKKSTPSSPQRPYKATFLKKSHFKRNLAVLTAVIFLVVIGIYSFAQTSAGSSAKPIQVLNSNWKTAPLTNAVTGQSFTLSFPGKVVVLQFMATYCQYCLAEGRQLVSVQQSLSRNSQAAGQVVMISVDVDPNENVAQLKNYVQQNNLGAPSSSPAWFYAMDTSGQLLQSVVGNVDFGSFISLANMYFINQQQSNTFQSMQRSLIQDASPASDIIAVVNKLL